MKNLTYLFLLLGTTLSAQQFGYTTWDEPSHFNDDYVTWWKIETGPSDSGEFTHVGFYQNAENWGGDLVRMGLYDDNGSDSPNNKLAEVPSFTVELDTYNQIELDAPITLDPSTVYWVAFHCNERTGFGELSTGSVPIKYKSVNFANTWPDPAGTVSGYTEDGGNLFAIGNGSVVLPVELLQFQVEKKDNNPHLLWSTATEITNEGWNIQRSTNGFTWTTIDWVDGAGDSYNKLDYAYTDLQPINGLSFYRLEQLDTDGEKSYSSVRSIEHKTKRRSIYPNPVQNEINLLGYGESHVSIVNMKGETILSQSLKENTPLEIDYLVPGNYLLTINENGNIFSHTFIKK